MSSTFPTTGRARVARIAAHAGYALLASGLFPGITYFGVPFVARRVRRFVAGTWLESHFRWQIRTFWFSLLWLVAGFATLFSAASLSSFSLTDHPWAVINSIGLFGAGAAVAIADFLWVGHRVLRGWVRLSRREPMYTPAA